MNPLRPVALALIVTALASCGSDSPPAATDPAPATTEAPTTDAPTTDAPTTDAPTTDATDATTTDATSDATDASVPNTFEGSEFCRVAADAETIGDQVEAATAAGPEELERVVTAALTGAHQTLALAPADIVDVMARTVAFQDQFVALLQQYDWDADAAFASPEAQDYVAHSSALDADLHEVRSYLEEHCGIVDDSDQPDTTVAATDLPDGDAGIRRFLQLYALGADVEVTPEQEDCFVEQLTGHVEVDQLEAMLAGGDDNETEVQIGLAVFACDIPIDA